MLKFYAIFALFGLIGLANAGKDDWFAGLKKSAEEMKRALNKGQLDDITNMRKKVNLRPDVEFDEPIQSDRDIQLYKVTSEYLDGKENFDGSQSIEFYKQKFNERITRPCDTFDDIMGSTLADYYMNEAFGVMTFEDVKKVDPEELEMLYDARFCLKITQNLKQTIGESYNHFITNLKDKKAGIKY